GGEILEVLACPFHHLMLPEEHGPLCGVAQRESLGRSKSLQCVQIFG
ncbi:uncharacterized protein METZ01_LOCUS451566, partial [marine metagenome]